MAAPGYPGVEGSLATGRRRGRAFVGTSGYDYPRWRGAFYPRRLPRHAWLAHAAGTFNSIELNGTFYSLKSPAVFRRWAAEAPARGFVFAVTYFDNDARARAPLDARGLLERVRGATPAAG